VLIHRGHFGAGGRLAEACVVPRHLCYKGVTRVLQAWYKGATRVYNDVSMMLQRPSCV
jgi:hypothetical protein